MMWQDWIRNHDVQDRVPTSLDLFNQIPQAPDYDLMNHLVAAWSEIYGEDGILRRFAMDVQANPAGPIDHLLSGMRATFRKAVPVVKRLAKTVAKHAKKGASKLGDALKVEKKPVERDVIEVSSEPEAPSEQKSPEPEKGGYPFGPFGPRQIERNPTEAEMQTFVRNLSAYNPRPIITDKSPFMLSAPDPEPIVGILGPILFIVVVAPTTEAGKSELKMHAFSPMWKKSPVAAAIMKQIQSNEVEGLKGPTLWINSAGSLCTFDGWFTDGGITNELPRDWKSKNRRKVFEETLANWHSGNKPQDSHYLFDLGDVDSRETVGSLGKIVMIAYGSNRWTVPSEMPKVYIHGFNDVLEGTRRIVESANEWYMVQDEKTRMRSFDGPPLFAFQDHRTHMFPAVLTEGTLKFLPNQHIINEGSDEPLIKQAVGI